MGNSSAKENTSSLSAPVVVAATETSATGEKTKKCKACCACPETKKARDQCIIENGEENCGTFIDAHKKCMRDNGYNV